ncbi:allantoate deiminase [Domibacillus sp. A3M-37]|uniref:allantoate deiminase n=1 Tax=Domibacillus sp. A3M-37 TaxID=2962037 RepID=UPI0020B778E5|nr:allantoate deiminase [Domibacillus sp. A3M-37]MCP3763601.1 allantoate deiminase [Domibacillus sp. A3M-37]
MSIPVREAEYKFPTADEMIKWLASFGATANGGVTRLLYSEAWSEAQHALKSVMHQKGLDARFDEVGNLFGRLTGTDEPESVILTGSHIDTVKDGGQFDGAYGIVASLMAMQRLYEQYGPPKRTIDVVSLAEEEGSRFPLTFWGSGWITGRYSLEEAEHIYDADGISLKAAMEAAGFGLKQRSIETKKPKAFVEVHVEQGIVLERKKKSIGVVSHIVGQRRYTVQFKGESNHAGTTPMSMRKDAMRLMAEWVIFLSDEAEAIDESLVATVGKVTAKPNMPNVVAGKVECSLDVRHYDMKILDQFEEKLKEFKKRADRRGMTMSINQWMNVKPVALDQEMMKSAARQAEHLGFSYETLISGAGHDSQVFGEYCPTMLLFVPSRHGISHSPDEWTEPDDLEKGIQMLMGELYALAYV